MHRSVLYESFSDWFSVVSAVTAVFCSDAIWNIDVMATIAICKSPCLNFKNVNVVPCAGDQNRSSMEKSIHFLLLVHFNNMIFIQ